MSIENPSPKDDGDQFLVEFQGIEPPIVHEEFEEQRYQAALTLQKVYKSFRTRRQLADCAVLIDQKWWLVIDSAQLKNSSISFFEFEKPESAFSKWSRARRKAAKVGKGSCKDDKARQLALQHWLEAIDPRHRYGHNLQFYYLKWLECRSKHPFFYWLDIGDGREENLIEKCPRQKLLQQCIKYLSPIERQKYEVKVEKGRFLYKETGEILDTTTEPKGTKWIFVLSTLRVLYVGKKIKGKFQHSSFLAGGATLSAGRLVVDDGFLKAVWPHSGHYLPTEENFQAFMSFLMDHNVDITRIQKEPDGDEEDQEKFKKNGTFIALLRRLIHNSTPNTTVEEAQGTVQSSACNDTKPREKGNKEDGNAVAEDTTSTMVAEIKICTENEPVEPSQDRHTSINGSTLLDGHESGEASIMSEKDLTYTKLNLSGEEKEDESIKAILPEVRKDSHRRTKSYQLEETPGYRWITGPGARIGCLRHYPAWLQYQTLEQVNISPTGVGSTNLSGPLVSSSNLKPSSG